MNELCFGTVVELCERLDAGQVTSTEVVGAYLRRIEAVNPELRGVIATNPAAMEAGEEQDALRRSAAGGVLAGVPILIKDNIETLDDMPTTAGSYALADNLTGRDAEIVARLRAAGAVVIGKANLSEWANFRSTRSSSGWSAVGGQARNPHDPLRSPCGSSSGSALAVAAGMAPAAIGTETNGSIVCPSSVNGVVGFKPTLGVISQAGIVPISHTQDTAGPMTQTVGDAALLMAAIAGDAGSRSPTEPARDRLEGMRLGVLTAVSEFHVEVTEVFRNALAGFETLGAHLVHSLRFEPPQGFRAATRNVLLCEFKHNLNRYLLGLPNACGELTLARLIEFNRRHAEIEMPFFRQELFEMAEATAGLDSGYEQELALIGRTTRQDGIDRLMDEHRLDALLSVTTGPAWTIDWVNGDARNGGGDSTYPAVAGYPHVTVPMGQVRGLPVGLSLIAGRGSDRRLLDIAAAFERGLPG